MIARVCVASRARKNKESMRRSLALEVALVSMLLVGAFTYQVMRKKAEENNIVPTKAPELPKQTVKVDTPDIPEDSMPLPKTEPKKTIKRFLEGVNLVVPKAYDASLSMLGERPDWSELDAWQNSISRSDFERLLKNVYTVGEEWRNWVTIEDTYAVIRTHVEDDKQTYQLNFSDEPMSIRSSKRFWRSKVEIVEQTKGAFGDPERIDFLKGLKVAIDPGHIGGDWAQLEARYFQIGGLPPVCEGDLTLQTGRILKEILEHWGAEVTMVREDLHPLNDKRPFDYTHYGVEKMLADRNPITEKSVQRMRERLFYRIGEIRTRAEVVNKAIKPDIVICLHYNAEAWGDPANPDLVDVNHFHILLHGAFTAGELRKDDERFSLFKKLLQRVHDEEAELCEKVAQVTANTTKLEPYQYEPNSSRARNIKNNPYMWARNLLANRLYECPVVYMEPYVMNSVEAYNRIQEGDYLGLKFVDGELVESIHREYAYSVALGLKEYYQRKPMAEEKVEE